MKCIEQVSKNYHVHACVCPSLISCYFDFFFEFELFFLREHFINVQCN